MATRNALSCSFVDVNNAVNGGGPFQGPANAGDIVNLPANIVTGGTFVLHGVTFDWDVSSATMKTGLVGAGLPAGITVVGNHFDGYRIKWPTNGPQTALTGSASGITPSGLDLTVGRAVVGVASGPKATSEVQYVTIGSSWPSVLNISKGIKLQGQTTAPSFFLANTLVAGASIGASLSGFSGTLNVVSTAGFNPDGGILDVCSTTEDGQLSYTGKTSTTFTGCVVINGTSGILNQYSFVGQGTCEDKTKILVNGSRVLSVDLPITSTDTVDISGLTFQYGSGYGANGWIYFTATPSFRFHHCHLGSRIQSLRGFHFSSSPRATAGLIDHCVIDNPDPQTDEPITQNMIHNTTSGAFPDNDASWSEPSDYGSAYGRGGSKMLYFEDNYMWKRFDDVNSVNTFDGNHGLRIVVRRNVIFNPRIFDHGTEGSGRGGRMIENYNNVFVIMAGARLELATRSGTYLLANNTYRGRFNDVDGAFGPSFRAQGTNYATNLRLGSAYGWNPWDFNDTSTGSYTNCKVPDTTTLHPDASKGTGTATNDYPNVVNGFYVKGVVTSAPAATPSYTPSLYDTTRTTWKTDQWVNFGVTRVKNATSDPNIKIAANQSAVGGGTDVDLGSLKGTGKVVLFPGSGSLLYVSIDGTRTTLTQGAKGVFCLGCLTVPGSPSPANDRYILFQWINGDTVEGCYSPETSGTVAANTVVESGDMWTGNITGNTAGSPGPAMLNTQTNSGDNGSKFATIWANGDKYVVARVLVPQDMSTRGASDHTAGLAPRNFLINTDQGNTAKWVGNNLEPDYCFNNNRLANNIKAAFHPNSAPGGSAFLVIENRDYFNDTPSQATPSASPWASSGIQVPSGIASGLIANRPSGSNYNAVNKGDITGATNPVPTVGYYATDEDKLYVLTGPGQWTLWWKPYTYPHPLILGSVTQSITSASTASFINGVGGTFQAVSFGFSASPTWSKTGTLPTGTTFDSAGLLTVGGSTAAGSYSFTIVATNGSETASQSFTLTVAAAATKIIGLTGPLTFGNVDVNTTSTKTLTISNTGTVVLTVTSITLPSGFTANWTSGTIAVGGSQQVIITFAPLTSTLYSGTITVASDKTSGTNTASISGTGATRVMGLSGSLAFGDITVGQTATRQLTISNTGNVALAISAITYPEGFSGDFVTASVAAGGFKILNVTFSPLAAQLYSGNVSITSDKTSGTAVSAASGTGVATATKIVQLSGSLAFGSVQTGTSVVKVLTITNSGNTTLTVTDLTLPTGYMANWTSGTIASGASQNVNITFSPVAAVTYNGTATVVSDATGGLDNTPVTGTGVAPSTKIIGLSGSVGFGNVVVNTTSTRTLTITNTGSTILTVTSITYPTGYSGAFSGTIAAGASQDVVVTFSPTLVQAYAGTITVNSDKTSGTNTVDPSGNGVAISTIVISVTGNLTFGAVQKNHSIQRIMTISNTGTADLVVSSITCPTGFTVNWSGGTIAPGASQAVTVTFRPTANQSYGGDITVNSNKTAGINTIACSGTGTNKRQVPFILIVR